MCLPAASRSLPELSHGCPSTIACLVPIPFDYQRRCAGSVKEVLGFPLLLRRRGLSDLNLCAHAEGRALASKVLASVVRPQVRELAGCPHPSRYLDLASAFGPEADAALP